MSAAFLTTLARLYKKADRKGTARAFPPAASLVAPLRRNMPTTTSRAPANTTNLNLSPRNTIANRAEIKGLHPIMALLTATPILPTATKYRSLPTPRANAPLRAKRAKAVQFSDGSWKIRKAVSTTA